MNGYLLDTGVPLIAVAAPERLSVSTRAAIEHGPTLLSVIAYWEVTIKSMKGTLEIEDPRDWWIETLEALSLVPLQFLPDHIAAIHDLPPIHQDPFDRALIAQATIEDLTLVTTDRLIPRYASERFRVLR